MKIISIPQEMTSWSREQAQHGKTVALVPTMGFFHDGHLHLMRKAGESADKVVVSLFVNPTQFGPGEDLEQYPRDFERDCKLAGLENVDVIFAPEPSAMYPHGAQTIVQVDRIVKYLCGARRPGHFQGVATVVCKLLNIVQPAFAVFGEKDFQQLAVIRRMVTDLNMDVSIIGYPIVRESDGLAMSSRNIYLDSDERKSGLCLSGALALAREKVGQGMVDAGELSRFIENFIKQHAGTSIEYVCFSDCESLEPVQEINSETILAIAVKINNKVRLIDNGFLSGDSFTHN